MEVLNGATDSGRGVRRFAFHLHLICPPTTQNIQLNQKVNGGESGVRTHGAVISSTHDFQSCSFGQLGHLSANQQRFLEKPSQRPEPGTNDHPPRPNRRIKGLGNGGEGGI